MHLLTTSWTLRAPFDTIKKEELSEIATPPSYNNIAF